MPRPIIYILLILIALSLVPLVFLAKARVTDSALPRIQVVPDMDNQPKFKAQSANPLFADGRAMRPPVPGTVARGDRPPAEPFLTGKVDTSWVARAPVTFTAATLQRGRERFDIFCAACHGLGGRGNGMVNLRAEQLQEGTWIPPTDLTSQVVVDRPDGHLFNSITHGIRNMPPYGSQIPPEDRWAIVGYLRALQRSRSATLDEVPPDVRPSLTAETTATAAEPESEQ